MTSKLPDSMRGDNGALKTPATKKYICISTKLHTIGKGAHIRSSVVTYNEKLYSKGLSHPRTESTMDVSIELPIMQRTRMLSQVAVLEF
jgi:hypothetical protein